MKFKIEIVLFLLLVNQCTHHIDQAPEIIEFINSKGEYSKLTDQEELPENVKAHYSTILEYMESYGMEIENYFVWDVYVEENDSILEIPICHYDGFVREYESEKQANQLDQDPLNETGEGDYILTTEFKGNISGGKDGYLILNKKNGQIEQFLIWR